MKEIFLSHLAVKDPRARQAAIDSLLCAPHEVCIRVLEQAIRSQEDRNLRGASMDAYRKLGRKSVDSLLKLLKDSDWNIRMYAANLLGDIGDSENGGNSRVLQALMAAAKDPEENVRIAAIEAIGKTGLQEGLPVLAEAVKDAPWVSMAALDAMAQIGGPEALELLCSNLKNYSNPGVIISVLEKIKDLKALRVLSPYLSKNNGAIRELALKSIVNICLETGYRFPPEFFYPEVPFMAELAGSPRKDTARCALIALSWSGDARGIERLLEALGNEEIKQYAVSGLINVGRKGVPAIVDFMKSGGSEGRPLCAVILTAIGEDEALAQFASDNDPLIRAEVASALGRVNSRRAYKLLRQLADDPDEHVRAAALNSMQTRTNKDTDGL
ncbi:MAG: HEAT repeat domain-containing protein [Nitrospiraceae bacterium]|nr:HEAT repeat domain-containing protein [Nitrospiraceae bacterium]